MKITHVRKRTGELVPFDAEKITAAIQKAMRALDLKNKTKAENRNSTIIPIVYIHACSIFCPIIQLS